MATYPAPLVGQRLTADFLASMLEVTVYKTADQVVTSNVTPANDTELFLPVEANATYAVHGWIRYLGVAATEDLRVDYAVPTSATFIRNDYGPNTATAAAADTTDWTTQPAGTNNGRGITAGIERGLLVMGYLATSTTAGNFQFKWAQVTSGASSVTVKFGSWFKLKRIA